MKTLVILLIMFGVAFIALEVWNIAIISNLESKAYFYRVEGNRLAMRLGYEGNPILHPSDRGSATR